MAWAALASECMDNRADNPKDALQGATAPYLLVVHAGSRLQVEASLHREAEHAHHCEVLASCSSANTAPRQILLSDIESTTIGWPDLQAQSDNILLMQQHEPLKENSQ